MLDIRLIRENPGQIKVELKKVGFPAEEVDRLLASDARRRKLQHDLDEMRARRTRESKELGKMAPEEREARRAEMRALGQKISEDERELTEAEAEFLRLMLLVPNLPRPHVPVGEGESANSVARSEGEPRSFDFTPLPHWELGEKLGIIDFERGVKLSGSRFYVLMGLGARLERALIAMMLDLKREQGYLEVAPPLMVNTETVTGTAHLPKFADTMYRDIEEDYWFIPTAEVPLTNLYAREILDPARLPIYLTAYTPCFRREKMSAGRDVRGIKRSHQFDKVEMVKLVRPEDSDAELEALVENACEVCRRLGLAFRVIRMGTGDLGFAAAAKYDVEVWAPGCGEWLEVSSCSNCWDFQGRRAQIRFRSEKTGRNEFVHTLNGSGLGLPRTFIAVLENYQQADGSVLIPSVLRPYLDGVEAITAPAGGSGGARLSR
ncbi:MAG TPA: serine--tRNA ligase [Candidatus Binataceae bacterium]|nr:serine--tRNA ligase [Candidatus Binataceae bacterium]